MSADLIRVFHDLDQLIGKILRMGCHEPDALDFIDFFYFLQKLCEGNFIFQVFTVGVDVLTKQHNFYYTICHKTFDLTHDCFWITAPLSSSYVWHNAVAAEIIAAKHDIDTGFKGILSLYRQVFHDLIGILPDVDDHAAAFKHAA